MATGKTSPAFMFYASDTMADKRYRLMTLAERGLYLSMLSECWVNRSVPAEPCSLARWLGYTTDEINQALTDRVKSFFNEQIGELTSPDIERYRSRVLEQREKQSKGGKKGAETKWNKPSSNDGLPNGLPNGLSMGSRTEQNQSKIKSVSLSKGELSNTDTEWINNYEQTENELEVKAL